MVPASKVDKYPDWDKRMLGIRCGKATCKISSESNQLYLTTILSVLDRNKTKPNLTNHKHVINRHVEPKDMTNLLDDFFQL